MMTKQKEIREGMAQIIKTELISGKASDWAEWSKGMTDNDVSEYIGYLVDIITIQLQSQGVVIKVDRELPICFGAFRSPKNQRENDYLLGWNDNKDKMFEAGYVAVEPLIKEVENEQGN